MKPVDPATGWPSIRFAENQPEYVPITVDAMPSPEYGQGARYLVARFSFSDEERERIVFGEDLYVSQLNWGGPMTPILVSCGVGPFQKDE